MAAGHSWSGVFLLMYFGKHVLMWHEQDFCVSLPALWLTADQGFQLLPPAWDTIYWLIRSATGHYTARVKECEREIQTSLGHKNIRRATGHFCCQLEQTQTDRKNQLNWSGHWCLIIITDYKFRENIHCVWASSLNAGWENDLLQKYVKTKDWKKK